MIETSGPRGVGLDVCDGWVGLGSRSLLVRLVSGKCSGAMITVDSVSVCTVCVCACVGTWRRRLVSKKPGCPFSVKFGQEMDIILMYYYYYYYY